MHKQAKPVTATDQSQRRFRRPQYEDVRRIRRRPAQAPRMRFRVVARLGADDDAGEPSERRQGRTFALGDFALIKSSDVSETIARMTGWSG